MGFGLLAGSLRCDISLVEMLHELEREMQEMESREMEEGKSVLGRCIGRSTHTCILLREALSVSGEKLSYIIIAENFILCHLAVRDGEE